MAKKNIGVLFGGKSVEHDVSVLSAKNIIQNIDRDNYMVSLLGIDKKGKWYLCESIDIPINSGVPLTINLDATNPMIFAGDKELKIDAIFPILHGTDGEDGSVQGLLKTLNIAYVGSGVIGSAAAMDKLITKRVLQSAGLPVADFLAYSFYEQEDIHYPEVVEKVGLPFIIKPVNLGSSVGVTKVTKEEEFKEALDIAFNYDTAILIEEFVAGREVECAIMGNEDPVVSVAGEIVLSKTYDFYSFTAKYEDPDSAHITIPADMPESIHNRVKELSLKSYQLLNCLDLARVDLFVKENGDIYVNEINTLPGFTNISMYPSLIQNEGIGYSELITRLIEMALKRHAQSNRISTDYASNL